MDNTPELNYKLANVLGVTLRSFTDTNISPLGSYIDLDSLEAKEILEKATRDHTLLKMTSWDKGIIYEGSHDGWHFEYKLPATECYNAKPEVLMQGDIDRWRTALFFITPELVPDYCNNWVDCLQGWYRFKEKYQPYSINLTVFTQPKNTWLAEVMHSWYLCVGTALAGTLPLAVTQAMLTFDHNITNSNHANNQISTPQL